MDKNTVVHAHSTTKLNPFDSRVGRGESRGVQGLAVEFSCSPPHRTVHRIEYRISPKRNVLLKQVVSATARSGTGRGGGCPATINLSSHLNLLGHKLFRLTSRLERAQRRGRRRGCLFARRAQVPPDLPYLLTQGKDKETVENQKTKQNKVRTP